MSNRRPPTGPLGKARLPRPHFAPARLDRHERQFRVPPSLARPKRMFLLCHYCAYAPTGDVPSSGVCPKCGGSSWERFALAEPLVPAHMK